MNTYTRLRLNLKIEQKLKYVAATLAVLLLSACTGLPENVKPVDNFQLNKYLGTWYEIARLDHSFERGLNNVMANYTLKDDGGVMVTNRGFNEEDNTWEEAIGKAYFVGEPEVGHLKVSFFGPFYGSYIVFELQQSDYEYSFVSGPDHSYLWLLSRTPTVNEGVINRFVEQAQQLGFNSEKIIFVDQAMNNSNFQLD